MQVIKEVPVEIIREIEVIKEVPIPMPIASLTENEDTIQLNAEIIEEPIAIEKPKKESRKKKLPTLGLSLIHISEPTRPY